MTGRRLVGLLAVAMLVPSACTGSGGAAETISVLVAGDPQELRAYRAVADAYEAAQDAVDVNLIEVAERDELIARLSTSIAGGRPPDLFLLNYRYYGQFETRGALEPIESYLASSSAFAVEDFYPEAMEAFRDDGEQTCLPQNVSSLVVYFNRDLFVEAGVEEPREGWDWTAMVGAATALTRDTDGDGAVDIYGLGVDPEIIRIAPFIWSNGGHLVNDEDRPTRFALTDPRAVQAVQAFFDLRARVGVTPTDEEAEAEELESRFLTARLGMLMESRRAVPTLRTVTSFEWDVAPLPIFERPSTILHSDAYCMTAASERKDAAWDYLEFALGEEGQRIAAETGRTVPSLRSVAESPAFLEPGQPPANAQVFLDNIELVRSVPHIATWPEIEDVANAALEEGYYSALAGEAEEVVRQIQRQTAPLFERAYGSS